MTQWGLDTLFNPAKRHMDEEKRRLQSTREEIGDSSGGKRIDLESGRVTIRRDAAGDPDDAPEASGSSAQGADEAASEQDTPGQDALKQDEPKQDEPKHGAGRKGARTSSAAAQRAAARRAKAKDRQQ